MSDETEWLHVEQALRAAGCHRITVHLGGGNNVTVYAADRDVMAQADSIRGALEGLLERVTYPMDLAYALSMDTPEMMGLSPESEGEQ